MNNSLPDSLLLEDSTNQLLQDVCQRATRYWAASKERDVRPSLAAIEGLTKLRETMPSIGVDPQKVLHILDEIGSPATVSTTGSRYFGFVVGGVLPAALAANWLTSVWDQNACMTALSPVSAVLEEVAIGWLADVLGLGTECGGAFVSGATMANFTGLAAARHALLKREGWNVEEDGLFGAPPVTVVVGAEVHASLEKALAMLGLGRGRVIRVPTDSQGRMEPGSFPALPQNSIVCLQAGNVNTGACDPAEKICELAHQAKAWVHVDGAFGLWAAAAPSLRHLTAGFEQADSWAIDAHKWLNVNYDSAIALTRYPEAFLGAFGSQAAYFKIDGPREPMQYGPEMSRRARAIEIWAALKFLGRDGLEDLITRTCSHALRFAEGLRTAGFEILNEVTLNQVLVNFGDSEKTQRVIRAIQDDGTCWCGGTLWHGKSAIRISISSWRTTASDVDRSLQAIIACARSA